jgi:hypothetical protein
MTATELTLDLSKLSEEQLSLLVAISPEAAKRERMRRSAFVNLTEAFTALAQVGYQLEVFVDLYKKTAATQALLDSRAIEVINRALATAMNEDIAFEMPKMEGSV